MYDMCTKSVTITSFTTIVSRKLYTKKKSAELKKDFWCIDQEDNNRVL